jgi:hypothetical protein
MENDAHTNGWPETVVSTGKHAFTEPRANGALTDNEIYSWLLGENGDFLPAHSNEQGLYWWRAELRKRVANRPASYTVEQIKEVVDYAGVSTWRQELILQLLGSLTVPKPKTVQPLQERDTWEEQATARLKTFTAERDVAILAIRTAWESLSWAQKGVCVNYRFPEDLLTTSIALHKKYIAQDQENAALKAQVKMYTQPACLQQFPRAAAPATGAEQKAGE